MKTIIIGGGKGCKAIIDLAAGAFLKVLSLDIQCVVDINPDAPGMLRARELGVLTCQQISEGLAIEGIELVIELTGQNEVLERIYRMLPPGIRVIDHAFAHVFWDLVYAKQEQDWQLMEITELEQKIEQERHFLQSIFDSMLDLVVVFDLGKRITHINTGMEKFTGYTLENIQGSKGAELLKNTKLRIFSRDLDSILNEVIQSGDSHSVIWQTSVPEEMHWEVTFTPIINNEGDQEAIVGTWHRITEKIQLQREIERAEQWLKSFIDSANDWISIKDIEGRYLIINPECAQAFNKDPEDFIGKKPEEVLSEDIADLVKKHDNEVVKNNRYQTFEETFFIKGRQRHYQTVRFPMTDHNGDVVGVCNIARDITSIKELNEQLVQAAKLAAVGKLAAGVAHEINNPLTGILAYAEDMLEDLKETDPKKEDLDVIIHETMRCRNIVRNLLDFARLGKLHLVQSNPNQIVEQSLLLVEKLPQFRNINISKKLEEDIPNITCDTRQLQQVILNMMLNAVDAMNETGKITVFTEYDRSEDKCIFGVKDRGPGVDNELGNKIFEPFFSTKGTNGLGLAVSWGIVERHYGTIAYENVSPDGGAVFKIILPASKKQVDI